jgi:hypothetical protein
MFLKMDIHVKRMTTVLGNVAIADTLRQASHGGEKSRCRVTEEKDRYRVV